MRWFQAILCCLVLFCFAAYADAGFIRAGGECPGGVCPLPGVRVPLLIERVVAPPVIAKREQAGTKTAEVKVSAEVRPAVAGDRNILQRVIHIFKRR